MTDVMHDLAERASTHLLTLSGGSFSLITNGSDFQVRDHRNADELRNARTLSGGESQRIRLASQIGSGLSGVLYVLDEPSIGLHQRDNDRLLETLKRLRDLGNQS